MDSSPEALRAQAQQIERRLKSLLNTHLKDLCKKEGLAVSGVKSVLQNRLLERLNDLVVSGDSAMFNTFRGRVNELAAPQISSPSYNTNASSSSSSHQQTSASYPTMPNGFRSISTTQNSSHSGQTSRLTFKESPFYTILEPLTNIVDLPVMTSARNTAQASFMLSAPHVDRIRNDKSIKIMLYCAQDAGYNNPYPVDLAFPNQVELKVNAENYQGSSLRGIKKKPGTTRPADITEYTQRRYHNALNTVTLTYAATDRVHNPSKYSMIVYLVRKHSVEELVDKIKKANMIAKQTVINEMVSRANDSDIVTTSSIMSLKCPLSTMRMTLPTRSINCPHNQCFDATSFLQVQEQAPQWQCPTCNRHCPFEQLAVDLYVQDIIQKVPKSVEAVTIEPNGVWRIGAEKEEPRPSTTSWKAEPLESDDIVEVSETRLNGTHEGFSTPRSSIRTPQPVSAQPSRAASSVPRSSSKRPAEDVVDLTLDSDEDEPPRRPVKRQSTGTYLGVSDYAPTSMPLKPTTNGATSTSNGLSFPLPQHPHNSAASSYATHGYGNWN